MADASLQIGNGNWGVKTSLLLGYNVVSNRYNPIEIGVTRETLGSRTNQDGIIDYKGNNIARINYASGVGSLLLEPQRTNLALQSEDFSFASWIKKGLTTITANTTTSPDGTIDADTLNNASGSLVWDSGNTLQRDILVSASTTYTFSVYVKSLGSTTFSIALRNQSTGASVSSNIVPNSGWQRVTVTQTTTVNTSIGLLFGNTNGNVAIWGAQIELGSYPTSYIPTTTIPLTRNQDVCSKSGITDLIGQTEGVMFIESAALFNDSIMLSKGISISDGTLSNRIVMRYNNASNQLLLFGTVNGVNFSSTIIYNLVDVTQFAKIAIRYRVNDISLWVNGANRGTIISQALPINLSRFGFDSGDGSTPLYAKVKQLQLYKTYLTDTEMTQLTTL